MSRKFTSEDLEEIRSLLSAERLRPFEALTKTQGNAVILHQETMSLGAKLSSVTGVIEIALRNTVCMQLTSALSRDNWLTVPAPDISWSPPENGKIVSAIKQAKRAEYSKLTGPQKRQLDTLISPKPDFSRLNHQKLTKKRQQYVEVTDGQIISQLSFFFWKRLFSADYDATLWKRSLKKVFPNKKLSRAKVSAHLEVIYRTRNRLAHFEPVSGLRLISTKDSIDFLVTNLSVRHPNLDSPLAKLLRPELLELEQALLKFDSLYASLTT